MERERVLSAKQLTKRLTGEVPVTLVQDVDLEVDSGEFVAITGPSGSGKSSLLYLLGLLDRPSSGSIKLQGRDTSNLSENELADLRLEKLGFVFQFHFLLPEFSSLENVLLPMRKLGRWPSSEMKDRAEDLLKRLGLENEIAKLPKQLSGGQSQRVAIARALANDPILILADEPTGNLDSKASLNVRNILKDLAHRDKRTVLAVSHEADFYSAADRIVTIVDGRISATA